MDDPNPYESPANRNAAESEKARPKRFSINVFVALPMIIGALVKTTNVATAFSCGRKPTESQLEQTSSHGVAAAILSQLGTKPGLAVATSWLGCWLDRTTVGLRPQLHAAATFVALGIAILPH